MSVDDIRLRHREIIVPDLWTVHSDLLGQCIKDVRELLDEVERCSLAETWRLEEPYEGEVERLRKTLARADSTIVWFEQRKAASEALIEAAHRALSRMDPSNASWQLNEAIDACREVFK